MTAPITTDWIPGRGKRCSFATLSDAGEQVPGDWFAKSWLILQKSLPAFGELGIFNNRNPFFRNSCFMF